MALLCTDLKEKRNWFEKQWNKSTEKFFAQQELVCPQKRNRERERERERGEREGEEREGADNFGLPVKFALGAIERKR